MADPASTSRSQKLWDLSIILNIKEAVTKQTDAGCNPHIINYNRLNGGVTMATVSFRMDDTLKRQAEAVLEELGLNMTTAMWPWATSRNLVCGPE